VWIRALAKVRGASFEETSVVERHVGSMTARLDTSSGDGNQRGVVTLNEIRQQPDLWPTTLERVASSNAHSIVKDRSTVICGAGSSAYAASAIAATWANAVAIPTTDLLTLSREEVSHLVPAFASNGVLVSVARSGESPESVGVIARVKQMFPKVAHLAITCNQDGELARLPEVSPLVLDPRTNDRSLVMTGSFSNLLLAGMAITCGAFLSKQLPGIVAKLNETFPILEKIAQRLASPSPARLMVLTSATLVPLAREASLKALEMTAGRTVAVHETFLGVRHGPMSFLRPDSLVLCVLSANAERRRFEQDVLRELRQKKLGHVVVVASENSGAEFGNDFVPAVAPNLPDDLRGPFEIVFPQLLAYHLSLASQLDPDNPSPDGVITRVVQRFQLH
jgi:tagatose-6-phosphate ketose/aldose isomerase